MDPLHFTRLARRLAVLSVVGLTTAAGAGGVTLISAGLTPAHAQSTEEFREALEPYGFWQRSRRWGDVWVPFDKPSSWRPYTVGRWVFTDEWGWYWVSEPEEEAWGWITYHYGRWVYERGTGWEWVPGDEWAPAWVNWRSGDDFVGWAPLPPDDVIYEYDDDPVYWTFIPPRYFGAPRIRTYYIPPSRSRSLGLFGRTAIVNRTLPVQNRRFGVNPGIAPGFIASAGRRPIQTFQVRPRVLPGSANIAGAVTTPPGTFRGARRGGPPAPGAPSAAPLISRSNVVVQPGSAPPPIPLRSGERGHFGATPPRAAQGAPPPAALPPPSAPQPGARPPAGGLPPGGPPPGGPPPGGPRPGGNPPGGPPPAAAPSLLPPPVAPQTNAPVTPPPSGPPPQREFRGPPPSNASPPQSPPPGAAPQREFRRPPPPDVVAPRPPSPPPVQRAAPPPPPPVQRVAPPPPPVVRAPPPVQRAAPPPPPIVRAPPPPPPPKQAPPPQKPPKKPGEP